MASRRTLLCSASGAMAMYDDAAMPGTLVHSVANCPQCCRSPAILQANAHRRLSRARSDGCRPQLCRCPSRCPCPCCVLRHWTLPRPREQPWASLPLLRDIWCFHDQCGSRQSAGSGSKQRFSQRLDGASPPGCQGAVGTCSWRMHPALLACELIARSLLRYE